MGTPKPSKHLTDHTEPQSSSRFLASAPTSPTSTNASRNETTNYSTTTPCEQKSRNWSKSQTKRLKWPNKLTNNLTNNSSPNYLNSSTSVFLTSTPASKPWSRFNSDSARKRTAEWRKFSNTWIQILGTNTPVETWITGLNKCSQKFET